MQRYILTGAPGSGKTTLIRQLEILGHRVVEEAATDIIALEQAKGVKEPWLALDFKDKVALLQRQRQEIVDVNRSKVVFFDRSPVDTYVLCRYFQVQPTQVLLEEIARITRESIYCKKVFFIMNMGFCQQTEARCVSLEEALYLEQLHDEVYKALGYELIKVTAGSIQNRIKAILEHI
ncbi:MAG: ATPase [Chlamydiales bacterium]|jgi:predicted ATPase|nr:ATPase [Chlamydiales bacterium]